ncbi:MAG: hypothetical protein ACAH10_05560 [Methylophilaceae bacterium]
MKSNSILKAAVAATLVVGSAQAMATGYVNLPTSGASSAYIECNATGSYGQGTSIRPTTTANNTCAIFAEPSGDGYTQKSSTTRPIVMNNTYTGFTNVTVGTFQDQVWYKASTKSYSYKIRVNMNTTPYAELPSEEDPTELEDAYFEINDIQRTGFTNIVGNVQVAYRVDPVTDEVLFRAGRTSTAVPAVAPYSLPTSAAAPFDASTIDFTTDVNNEDPDGSSPKDSAHMYVKFEDAAGNTSGTRFTTASGTVKFKQLGQEGQPLITIEANGYKPSF